VTSSETNLPVLEYQEINAHLRSNTTAFVNWFSFFLTFSLVAAIAFLVTGEHRQGLRGLVLRYGVPIASLMLHVVALAGILIFRHYVTAAHRKLDEIVKLLGDTFAGPGAVHSLDDTSDGGRVCGVVLRMVLVALASPRVMANQW